VHDPKRGDWVKADGGVEGAITLVGALRTGTVEAPPVPAEAP